MNYYFIIFFTLILISSCSKKNYYDLPFQFWNLDMFQEYELYHKKERFYSNEVNFEPSILECPDTCLVELKNEQLVLIGVPNYFDVHSDSCPEDQEFETNEYSLKLREKLFEVKYDKTRELTKKELKQFKEKQISLLNKSDLNYLERIGNTNSEKKDFFRKILGKEFMINQYEARDFNHDGIDDYLVFFSYPEIDSLYVSGYEIYTGISLILSSNNNYKINYIDYDFINSNGTEYFEYKIQKFQGMNLIILSRYTWHRCNVLQSIDLISFK